MAILPIHDRVLLKRLQSETKSPGGIHIPDSAQEQPLWCEVLSVGPGKVSDDGKTFTECVVRRGDTVLVGKYAGTEVKIDGQDHLIVREEEILGVAEEDA